MKDLAHVLREGDPAADSELSASQAAAIRRAVVEAARQPDTVRTPWRQPLALAATLALTVAGGVLAGRHLPVREVPGPVPAAAGQAEGERRQLQFSTPGGTRIIWVFDPQFELKETVP